MEIKKYGSVSYGVEEDLNGSLVRIEDLISTVENILDDDSEVIEKLNLLLAFLKA